MLNIMRFKKVKYPSLLEVGIQKDVIITCRGHYVFVAFVSVFLKARKLVMKNGIDFSSHVNLGPELFKGFIDIDIVLYFFI